MYASERIFPARLKGRKQSTAERIETQFLTLLGERQFTQIAAADIADGAGIARSTFYRLYADPVEVLWAVALPMLEAALDSAFRGDSALFVRSFGRLWAVPGLVPALSSLKANARVRSKLITVVTARLHQRVGARSSGTCALVLVAALLAVIDHAADAKTPDEAALGELMSLIYIATYLTPGALQSIAREQARRGLAGGFPPAVSAEESLASDDVILSMIDGRPYRSLTRHIARYGMSPADYRRCFGLDEDYPMVAASYSRQRRALALSAGFGQRRPEQAAA